MRLEVQRTGSGEALTPLGTAAGANLGIKLNSPWLLEPRRSSSVNEIPGIATSGVLKRKPCQPGKALDSSCLQSGSGAMLSAHLR